MIADTDLSVNAFANDAIERQLKALEMFDFEDDIKSMTPPKEVDGKPVYNFVHEKKYIIGITMNLYVHVTDDEKAKEIENIEFGLKVI